MLAFLGYQLHLMAEGRTQYESYRLIDYHNAVLRLRKEEEKEQADQQQWQRLQHVDTHLEGTASREGGYLGRLRKALWRPAQPKVRP